MERHNLPYLIAFVTLAEHRSFRGAAAQLRVTPSALSHSIRRLEERLGHRLINRTTRSFSLTDAGTRLLDQLRPAFSQIDGALENLNEQRGQVVGRLKILASYTAATAIITPIWNRFLATYPKVDLDVHVSEGRLDDVSAGFDAVIGVRTRATPGMIAVRLMGPLKLLVVGSPQYFARRQPPSTPMELSKHNCIQYRLDVDGPVLHWPFEHKGKTKRLAVSGRLTVSNPELALRAAVDGLGIAYTTEAFAEPFMRSGQLVQVLEKWTPITEGLFLYYHGHRQVPTTLRAFIKLARSSAGQTKTKIAVADPFTRR